MENSISIDRKYEQNDIKIDIINLRNIEQNILNYMLLSNSNFESIKNQLSEDDFTFLIHKVIFKHLCSFENMLFTDIFQSFNELGGSLEKFAKIVQISNNVKTTSILDILSQPPSMYIERDLEIINANSMEKEIALNSNEVQRSGTIETKDGLTWFNFINDRLIHVGTTNIAQLPTELHDNFGDTLGSVSHLDLQNGENEASITFYGGPENPEGIESFYLKKDVAELKWFDDICKWADKYNLDENTFPRDRFTLQEIFELNLSCKGINELPKEIEKLSNLTILLIDNNNLKNLPKEIYHLKKLRILDLSNNNISHLSEDIINLKELVFFAACNNDIAILPQSFYSVINLKNICLHGNKLTMLSNNLGNFHNLQTITISNNDIDELPSSISKLENLKSLEIENTYITEIPIKFLKHGNLNKLCINDDVLSSVVQHIEYLDVDTINLSASHFQATSKIVQELSFKIDSENWVEDKDKKDNGCVQLFKYEEKEK